MRAFRARRREQAAEQTTPLPPELAELQTGQLGLLWQAAVRQAEAGPLAAREQADADIEQADRERDEALARVAALESELVVLREVVAERDRLTATGEHLAAQLKDIKAELKDSRTENRTLQAELLTLARDESKNVRVQNDTGQFVFLKEFLNLSNNPPGAKPSESCSVTSGLKTVYQAPTEDAALMALDAFAETWDDKDPQISKSWRAHWENLNTFFGYP